MKFGTYRLSDLKYLDFAIQNGVFEIDGASFYKNLDDVGLHLYYFINKMNNPLRENDLIKCNYFKITCKLWDTFHDPENVEYECRRSINKLSCKYLDKYLIHNPQAFKFRTRDEINRRFLKRGKVDIPIINTWKAMEELKDKGLVLEIGVSNFNSQQMKLLIEDINIKYLPTVWQIKKSILNNEDEKVEIFKLCEKYNIELEIYGIFSIENSNEINAVENSNEISDMKNNGSEKYLNDFKELIEYKKKLNYNFKINPIFKSENEEHIINNINYFSSLD